MKIVNPAKISEVELVEIKSKLVDLRTLGQVLKLASRTPGQYFLPQIVSEVIQQDEFTNDVIIPLKICFWFLIQPDSAQ